MVLITTMESVLAYANYLEQQRALRAQGWDNLPPDQKQQFYDIASEGDWTAQEAYDHLVPDTLKDNPEEVRAWMDGDPDIGVPDRDVSREVSGHNGGEYSTENTAMEVSSVNRGRENGADMTDAEIQARDVQNAQDIEAIEAHYTSDDLITGLSSEESLAPLLETSAETVDLNTHLAASLSETALATTSLDLSAPAAEVAAESTSILPEVASAVSDVATDIVLPTIYGVKSAVWVHNQVKDNPDLSGGQKLAMTVIGGGVTFAVTQTYGLAIVLGHLAWNCTKIGAKVVRQRLA